MTIRGVEAIRAHLGLHSVSTVKSMVRRGQIPTFVEAGRLCTSTDLLAAAELARNQIALARAAARAAAEVSAG